jgi:transcriptional regulator of NAD metabolism
MVLYSEEEHVNVDVDLEEDEDDDSAYEEVESGDDIVKQISTIRSKGATINSAEIPILSSEEVDMMDEFANINGQDNDDPNPFLDNEEMEDQIDAIASTDID